MDLNEQQTKGKYKIVMPKFYTISKQSKGYVYVVRVDNFIKIGSTKSPKTRLEKYKTFPPFKYDILLLEEVEDRMFYERSLQTMLINFQIQGEWFEMPNWKSPKKQAKDLLKYSKRQVMLQLKINPPTYGK